MKRKKARPDCAIKTQMPANDRGGGAQIEAETRALPRATHEKHRRRYGDEDYNTAILWASKNVIKYHGLHPVPYCQYAERKPYDWYIETALSLLSQCDAIYLLPMWEKSNGVTRYELPLAKQLGLPVLTTPTEVMEYARQGKEG